MKIQPLPVTPSLVVAFLIVTGACFGRNEWLSAKTVGNQSAPLSAEALSSPLPPIDNVPMARPPRSSLSQATPAAPALLDITVSIADDPAGDNNGNQQGQAGSAEQDKWERIIQHYADAIFEMTEGAQKIRKVRIFKKGRFASSADVVWTAKGWPHVDKGVGEPGGHVSMYNIFAGGGAGGADYNLLDDEQGAGYTMAHEYGHYFYGVYDEYPQTAYRTDIAVAPSVMSSQWRGKNDARWLNFSIKNNGGGDFQDTLFNRQHRVHNSSAWETIARNPNLDPSRGDLGRRIFYPELAAVAPTGTHTPTIQLPSANARSALNIIWADKVLFEIVIDNSGSMAGSPLTNAKTAAKLMIDRAELGESRIGIIKFDSTASVVSPVTNINTTADKTALKAAVDTIVDANSTAIGDAAVLALGQVQTNATPTDTSVVFLLSDGVSNVGSNPLSAIPAYQTAQVPIFTFAFGSSADVTTLRTMAEQTGGKFYVSPTSLSDITLAFQDAFSSAVAQTALGDAPVTVAAKKTVTTSIPLDVGISNLSMSVVIATGQATVAVYAPNNSIVPPSSTIVSGNETVYTFAVAAPAIGNWRLVSHSLQTTGSTIVRYQIGATPGPDTITLSAYSLEGTGVRFPAPVVVRAKLDGSRAVVGAYVTASATSPNGVTNAFSLHDDGVAPDEKAGDGTYSGYYYYTQNGTYTVNVTMDNRLKRARFSSAASAHSANILGAEGKKEADAAVGRAFVRTSRFNVTTSNGVFTTSVKQLPKGTYAGLLGDGLDHAHNGFLRMTLSPNGVYSGALYYGGGVYPLTGALSANGAHARNIARPGLEPLRINLRVDALNGSDLMTGEITDGGLSIPISLLRTYYSAAKPTPVLAPEAGRYTWTLLPTANVDPALVPPGIGYATMTVSTTGVVVLAGRLAEGTAFSCSTQVTKTHDLPVYASLYLGKGSMYGTLPFTGTNEFEGGVRFIKPARPLDKLYPLGFNTSPRTLGTLYTAPLPKAKALDMTAGTVSLIDGGLAAEIRSDFTFDTLNRFVFPLPNPSATKLAITTSTGALAGEFHEPVGNKVLKFYGAVQQNRKAGGGYFLGTTQGGSFEFGTLGSPATIFNYDAAGLPLSIPDANSTGVTSSITVGAQAGSLVKCRLTLHIAHSYRGDLVVTLISPSGTSIILQNRSGGGTDNVDFSDLIIPEVVGQTPNGTWQLKAVDLAGGDIGSIESWSLELSSR